MSDKKDFNHTFCPSPWFHMRINNTGTFEYCRWGTPQSDKRQHGTSIKEKTPIEWFQQDMSTIRQDLLSGDYPAGCRACHQMEEHGKVSGRHRQLLKTGIQTDKFEKTLLSSPWVDQFRYSSQHNGDTTQYPQDWQIDLGNFCNSACLFCSPFSSSRLAFEHKKIGIIEKLPPRAWCDDPIQLGKFTDALKQSKKISYLHFIGGETLITPAFEKIIDSLIHEGLTSTTLGFTTNLTVWNEQIIKKLSCFSSIHVGTSIECIHPVNDYVRFGGQLSNTIELLDKWVSISKQKNWILSIRTTPTVLSILHLDTIYDYALKNNLPVESCNFIQNPKFMRPTVLPRYYRETVINKLRRFTKLQNKNKNKIFNTRDPNVATQQAVEDVSSYINYLNDSDDESHRLPDLIDYLHKMELMHKNSVLDYLPEYEELFKSAGYQRQYFC